MYKNDTKIFNGNIECLETHYFNDISYRDTDIYITVDSTYINRLDLVAFDFYGSVNLWYIIAMSSNISNPLDVPLGTILRIPTLSSLYLTKGISIER